MIGEDYLHITEKEVVQEKSLVVQDTLKFQNQKKHYQYKLETDSNHLITNVWKTKYLIFSMLSEDLQILRWYASIYLHQFKQSLSTEPDKSLLSRLF